jgi:hypothetical protein
VNRGEKEVLQGLRAWKSGEGEVREGAPKNHALELQGALLTSIGLVEDS